MRHGFALVLALGALTGFAGCSSSNPPSTTNPTPPATATNTFDVPASEASRALGASGWHLHAGMHGVVTAEGVGPGGRRVFEVSVHMTSQAYEVTVDGGGTVRFDIAKRKLVGNATVTKRESDLMSALQADTKRYSDRALVPYDTAGCVTANLLVVTTGVTLGKAVIAATAANAVAAAAAAAVAAAIAAAGPEEAVVAAAEEAVDLALAGGLLDEIAAARAALAAARAALAPLQAAVTAAEAAVASAASALIQANAYAASCGIAFGVAVYKATQACGSDAGAPKDSGVACTDMACVAKFGPGYTCTETGFCTKGGIVSPKCTKDKDCPSSAPHCDIPSGVCDVVDAGSGSKADAGVGCKDATCVAKFGAGYRARRDGHCTKAGIVAGMCSKDADCPESSPHCDSASGVCFGDDGGTCDNSEQTAPSP